jgi:hypothetical protein
MANLGKDTSQLAGASGSGCGGGPGSNKIVENAPYILSRGMESFEQHEVNARRGYARGTHTQKGAEELSGR